MQYPYVKVELIESADEHVFLVSQAHFSRAPDSVRLWQVPLAISLNGQEMSAELLSTAQCYYRVPKPAGAPTPLLKLNSERIGFYRVLYSNELFDKLVEAIEDGAQRESLLPIERCGLLSDSFEFAKMGLLELADAMRLLWAFRSEADNKYVLIADLCASTLTRPI